jgi:hypothetical protein
MILMMSKKNLSGKLAKFRDRAQSKPLPPDLTQEDIDSLCDLTQEDIEKKKILKFFLEKRTDDAPPPHAIQLPNIVHIGQTWFGKSDVAQLMRESSRKLKLI